MERDQRIAEVAETKGVMGMMDISVSGMTAQSEKMRVLAEMVAQMNTARSVDEYKQKRVTFQENLLHAKSALETEGGVIAKVEERNIPLERRYDPANPAADNAGFVYLPKMSFAGTISEWSLANKHFEANMSMYKVEQQMAQTILDIGK
ncbi:MAG: hypothetical protein ABIH39_02705 [Candidatus Margulisiibacteriota bacterium]